MDYQAAFKDYNEACHFLVEAAKYGCVLGLDVICELLDRLGNPQLNQKFIHIAGTNGKGSVSTYIASVLCEAGYTVGRYNTPPNRSFREIIRLNEKLIDEESMLKYLSTVKIAVDSMVSEGYSHPTRFEIEVATALLFFQDKCCDFSILEVGMGGLLDATNIISKPLVSVITSISMDHMARLGDKLELIAEQKAGIIKDESTVVSILQNETVNEVINRVAKEKRNKIVFANPKNILVKKYGIDSQIFDYVSNCGNEFRDMEIKLSGVFQFENAIIAIEVIEQIKSLGFRVSKMNLKNGLKKARWKGRFTIIHEKPLFIIDGAHNEDAARRVAESLRRYFPEKKKIFILGISHDKEYGKIIEQTVDLADRVIAINAPDIGRLLSAEKLTIALSRYNKPVIMSNSIEDAVETAFICAEEDDIIIAFGSSSVQNSIENYCESLTSQNGPEFFEVDTRDFYFSDDEIHKYY